jgi:hypothetical protein
MVGAHSSGSVAATKHRDELGAHVGPLLLASLGEMLDHLHGDLCGLGNRRNLLRRGWEPLTPPLEPARATSGARVLVLFGVVTTT